MRGLGAQWSNQLNHTKKSSRNNEMNPEHLLSAIPFVFFVVKPLQSKRNIVIEIIRLA